MNMKTSGAPFARQTILCALAAALAGSGHGLPGRAQTRALTCPTTGIDWHALPAVIDGPGGEAWLTRHPCGGVIVFGRHDENWQNHRLYMTRLVGGAWTAPVRLPFTQDVDGSAPHFAPDGRSLLFVSSRSAAGAARPEGAREGNIWRVTWDGATWGAPQMLPAPINSPGYEIDAVEVNGGVIYFSSMPPGEDAPRPDLYRAEPVAGGYRVEPVAAVNTADVESTLYVTPDESLIVFHRAHDPAGLGRDDLFAARRTAAGWGSVVHLGGDANSPEYEYGPEISGDGSTLYFTTHRGGRAGIMAVDLQRVLPR